MHIHDGSAGVRFTNEALRFSAAAVVDIGDHDTGTRCRKVQRCGAPHARCCARDDGYFALYINTYSHGLPLAHGAMSYFARNLHRYMRLARVVGAENNITRAGTFYLQEIASVFLRAAMSHQCPIHAVQHNS